MKLKPYPKYKDSGIPWIGKIPEGWEVNRLKFLLETPVTDGPHETPEFIDEGIPFLSVDSIQDGKLVFENCRYISEKDYIRFKTKCNPKKNDVLMGKAASIGKIAIVDVDFEFSIWSPLALLRPNQTRIIPKVLEYVLKSDYSQHQIEIFATSNTQKNISMDDIPRMSLITPSFLDQTAIANFLDKKTARIDTLIEKDKKLIKLLKEKRTALINHAVTRGLPAKALAQAGLDSNVKMKDSGIEWIGDIPEGWEVRKLKFSLLDKQNSIKTGPFGSQLKIDEMYDHEIKVYNQKNVIEKDESIGENYVSLDKFKELIAFKTVPKDLLITTRGTIGRTLRLSKNAEVGILHPCLMKINTDNNKVFDRYIEILIEETDLIKVQLQLLSCATTIEVIYQDNLKEVKLILPPLPEQTAIANFLDKATSKMDKTIQKIEKKIKLLEEYKKSLIHYVVTGKVDVRGVIV